MKINNIAITGFEWDDGNSFKNWLKHKVTTVESEEVFFNSPLLIADDNKHSGQEARWYALGHTNSGRLLFVGYTVRNKRIRVITARPMNRKERKEYLSKSVLLD